MGLLMVVRMSSILDTSPDQAQSTYLAAGITWSVLNLQYTKQNLVVHSHTDE